MDSTSGQYMHYNNHNDDTAMSQFLNGVEDYANINNNSEPQTFDPALFADNGLASFGQQSQPSQSAQSNFNHAQHRTQSQSPALPQFKATQNTYSPQQYGQHLYNQQSAAQSFDPQMLSRPTPSPGPFDQFAYQPHMNYGQPNFNYYSNGFQHQQQRQQASTPSQAFRPQVNQQGQQFIPASRPSPLSQAHISQAQSPNGMPYSYQQQNQAMPNRFIEPSMLNAEGQLHNNISSMPQMRQAEPSPYFTKAGAGSTLDPRALQMQQHNAIMQHNQLLGTNAQQMPSIRPQPMQGVLHLQQPGGPMFAANGVQVPAKSNGKASGDASDSDDSLDIEDEEPPDPRPAIITLAKPAESYRKLEWEVVDAVWSPKNRSAPAEKIRAAVKFIGEAVRGVRDKWKDTNDRLKKAQNANQPDEVFKTLVNQERETMQKLAGKVIQFAHPAIIKRLGENLHLLSALYSFLLDRVNAEDYDSALVGNILLLATKFDTVDEEQFEKVKWTKILVRFSKKCTNQSKNYALQIIANAKKATIKKKAEAAGQGPASPSGSSSGQVAGVKRPREGSEIVQQAKKLAVKPSSKPLSVQLAEQRRQEERKKVAASKDARPTAANGTSNAAAAAAAKPKPATAVPQKTSQFASLLSAKKKPGTSLAERAAMQKAEPVKAPVVASPKTQPVTKSEPSASRQAATSSTSFLGFLADIDKPKEAPKQKVEEDPNETTEARTRRLRKEARKKLRVTWKPESELVETRIFEHDVDEETGHEDSQMRDVGDTGKEGEMLKHRLQVEEEDSDSDSGDDELPMEYFSPTEVDFSSMKEKPEDDFETTNYIKYGGNLKPESPSSIAQGKHEDGTQMAMYAAGEQPDSPKEPPEADDDEDFSPVVDFGEPAEDRVRRREQRYLASRQPYQAALQAQPQGFDLASALSSMQQQPQQGSGQQQDWLRALGLMGQTPQQQQQPQQQHQQLDLSKILAVAQQYQQQPQAAVSAYPAPAAVSAPSMPDVSALLGQLSGGALPNMQQPYGAVPPSLPVGNGDNPNPYPGFISSGKKDKKDKKRGGKNSGGSSNANAGQTGNVPLDSNGLPYNYKTKICQFWLENSCTKGDACTYRHDREGMDGS